MTIRLKKIACVLLSVLLLSAFAGCAKTQEEEPTTEERGKTVQEESENTTEPQTEETTTAAPVTQAPVTETTTAAPKDGESIQKIMDTLESKTFYMAGVMNLTGGNSLEAKATCDGENYRMEIVSKQMKMSIIYLDSVPYIVNNATNMYVVLDDAAINSLDQVLGSLSSFGVTFNSQDIADMKSMMSNFDQNMDYSQYIRDGEYYEYTATVDGADYLCSVYKTEDGSVRIYTQDGELKIIDAYDADGLRQMNFLVSAFIPQVLTPITMNGYTKATSLLNLFSAA